MNTKNDVSCVSASMGDDNWLSNLSPASAFEDKKSQIAAELAALMASKCYSRASIANLLQWNKSRVSRVLSGEANLTISTIWEFAQRCGFEFDVVYREASCTRPKQPWSAKIPEHTTVSLLNSCTLNIQSQHDVVLAIMEGKGKSHYISIDTKSIMSHMQPETQHLMNVENSSIGTEYFKLEVTHVG